jgi:hypothetical protein
LPKQTICSATTGTFVWRIDGSCKRTLEGIPRPRNVRLGPTAHDCVASGAGTNPDVSSGARDRLNSMETSLRLMRSLSLNTQERNRHRDVNRVAFASSKTWQWDSLSF